MEDTRPLIIRARDGDLDAFGEIVRRFQGVALRYAHAILGRWDLAEDAAQDAFVQAYLNLHKLAEPSAFAVWFRAIVHHSSHRLIRGNRIKAVPLEDALHVPSDRPGPAELAESSDMARRVIEAVEKLPEHERDVVRLFYFDGCSQREIADLLRVPVSTVNNRLHSSRGRLRRQAEIIDLMPPPPIEPKEAVMQLTHEPTRRRLLKGDAELTIRKMTREDIPAMRRLDDEITAAIDFANAQRAPGNESVPGGPWADDAELTRHFEKYEASGNLTLVAADESGRLVGFVDLWAAHEPEPFGESLDAQCIDYLWEYHHLGLEIVLLQEAEEVARAARLPALDVGTNTSSGDYPTYRRLGMKLFYEYDQLWCMCAPAPRGPKPHYRVMGLDRLGADRLGDSELVRVSHFAPTNFDFEHASGRPGIHEFRVDGHRVIADLWRLWEPGYDVPDDCQLFVPPIVLTSPELMNKIARAIAYIAGEAGAQEIPVPFPCDIPADPAQVEVTRREFKFAWMRKSLVG